MIADQRSGRIAAPRSTSSFLLLPSSFLFLLVILAYTPVWRAGFVWDDNAMLTANACIVGPLGLKEIWTTNAADICPFAITALWVGHALWGLTPLPYHLVNILMHAACAILLWRVLRSLGVSGAWLGAALWALHPVQVESVAWITEIKNTESGLFFLLSILFFVKHQKRDSNDAAKSARNAARNYGLSLLFATLAMASKSSTVVLPVVLCLCAWWIEGRWHWRNSLKMIPFFLLAIAASALSIWTQTLRPGTDPQWIRPWPQRLATAGDAVWFYLGKLLWPDPLMAVYPRWQINAGQWISYLPLAAVILLFAILWFNRRSDFAGCRALFFAFAYFIITLLPVLGLIETFISRYSIVFDHFQYLASIGPLALAGAGLARAWEFLSNQVRILVSKNRWLRLALCAGLLLVLGATSWQRTFVYQNENLFWSDAEAKNPDCWVGYFNIGNSFLQKGQADEAIAQYQKALAINSRLAEVRTNYGNALFLKRRLGDAIEQYQMALKVNPNYAQAHANLGMALFQTGRLDEAIAHYEKALEINPNYEMARTNLGNALLQKGQVSAAIDQYQMAIKASPTYALAHAYLGIALFQKDSSTMRLPSCRRLYD